MRAIVLGGADHDAGLRTSKQLVARERDHVAAGGEHLLRHWLVRQAVGREIDQRAAAKIGGQGHAMGMRDARQRGLVDRAGEALHGVVAGVHLHHERGAFADCSLIVVRVRAIGGTHFDQRRAGGGHHIGHAKCAADLDQLAARDDHLPATRQRGDR